MHTIFIPQFSSLCFLLSHRAIQDDKCRIKNVIFIPIFTYKDVYTDGWFFIPLSPFKLEYIFSYI